MDAEEFMQLPRILPALPSTLRHSAQKHPSKVLPVHEARTFQRLSPHPHSPEIEF